MIVYYQKTAFIYLVKMNVIVRGCIKRGIDWEASHPHLEKQKYDKKLKKIVTIVAVNQS